MYLWVYVFDCDADVESAAKTFREHAILDIASCSAGKTAPPDMKFTVGTPDDGPGSGPAPRRPSAALCLSG